MTENTCSFFFRSITINSHLVNKYLCNLCRLWQEVMSIPGNDHCCDCGANNPRWASINLGITLCIGKSSVCIIHFGCHHSEFGYININATVQIVLKSLQKRSFQKNCFNFITECSGIHRSLGVHYSKVRSLTLDAWEPEVVKVMSELGNTTINAVYLATYVPGGGGATPAPAKPDSER